MKTLSICLAPILVLLASGVASAGWTYVTPVPGPVVYDYWASAPIYAYLPPLPPGAVIVRPARTIYPAPVMIRHKVYYRGRPIRGALRAVLP